MNRAIFDVFISYRRDGGSNYAGTVYDYLISKKFHPFYDRTGMENGRFDEQIRINLINSENYILILSLHALDRVINDDDWVRHEISLALQYNLNIIVLVEEGFVFPESLPDEIENLRFYQQYKFKNNSIHSCLKEIESKLQRKNDEFDTFDPKSDSKVHIGGEYLTLYEDEDNGRIVTRKAPAKLYTIGNNIYGKTSFGDALSWRIKGKIYNKKRITGLYYAKSILDDGFGTFYLEIKSPSVMEGYWCGYDNANGKMFSGKYIFKKIYNDYTIRLINKSDFPRIIRISDNQLGKDYVNKNLLEQSLDKDDRFCYVAEAHKTKQPIAFAMCMVIDYEEAKKISRTEEIKDLQFYDKIGYIKTVVVDEHYEGYGIGSKIVGECIDYLSSLGCSAFISTAWKHAGVINIANILQLNDFYKISEIPNYWYEDSLTEGFQCPQCGNPCNCSCVIYAKI